MGVRSAGSRSLARRSLLLGVWLAISSGILVIVVGGWVLVAIRGIAPLLTLGAAR